VAGTLTKALQAFGIWLICLVRAGCSRASGGSDIPAALASRRRNRVRARSDSRGRRSIYFHNCDGSIRESSDVLSLLARGTIRMLLQRRKRGAQPALGLSMRITVVLFAAMLSAQCWAGEVEYRPGGASFKAVWDRFYQGDHEPELDDPLIAAGTQMTMAIVEAIAHKDMRLRRYAIAALGQMKDKRALPQLERILRDKGEVDYFRGDALHAIYRIDQAKGTAHAVELANENDYLRRIAGSIRKKEPWLLEATNEH
jgi:hypothetical protein